MFELEVMSCVPQKVLTAVHGEVLVMQQADFANCPCSQGSSSLFASSCRACVGLRDSHRQNRFEVAKCMLHCFQVVTHQTCAGAA